jgi:hypothetical protein
MTKNVIRRQLMWSGSVFLCALGGHVDRVSAACVSAGGEGYQCPDADVATQVVTNASAEVAMHPGVSVDVTPVEKTPIGGPAEPQIELSASSLDFGAQRLGVSSSPQSVTVMSVGAVDLQLGVLQLVGANVEDFAVQSNDCSLATLSPSQSCQVSIRFAPIGNGFRQAALQVPSDAPSSPDTVTLVGSNAFVFADGFESPTPLERVIEALNAVAFIRLWFSEHWYSFGAVPENMGDLGLDDPYPVGSAWATIDDGLIVITFDGNLDGQTLALAPWELFEQLNWSCGYAEPPKGAVLLSGTSSAARTTIDPLHLPESCTQP